MNYEDNYGSRNNNHKHKNNKTVAVATTTGITTNQPTN